MKTAEEKLEHAKDLALKALAARDRTRSELRALLLHKKVNPDVAEAAIQRLDDLGFIDDRRVAAEHIRRRVEVDGASRTLLEPELVERGVELGIVLELLGEALAGRDEAAEALQLAREKVRLSPARLAPEAIRRRVFAFLARRGFEEDVAREAVERASEEYLGPP